MGIGEINVNVVEQMFVHEPAITLKRLRLHRPVLIEVEGHDVLEGKPFRPVHSDQFSVDLRRRRAGRESEDAASTARLPSANEGRNFLRNRNADVRGSTEHDGLNLLDFEVDGHVASLAVGHVLAAVMLTMGGRIPSKARGSVRFDGGHGGPPDRSKNRRISLDRVFDH